MSATASEAEGRRKAREVPKRLRYAAFRRRPSGPSLPILFLSRSTQFRMFGQEPVQVRFGR